MALVVAEVVVAGVDVEHITQISTAEDEVVRAGVMVVALTMAEALEETRLVLVSWVTVPI